MSFEKTVFDENMLVQFLKDNWNLSCQSIEKTDLGTANCYYIKTDQDTYFLKEYQSEIYESQIIKESEILERLQERKIPSTCFISTVTNEKYIKYKGHFVVLEKYIYGDIYGYYEFPEKLLPKLAATLANIHLALEGMCLPDGLGEEWLKEDAISKYDKLLELLEEHSTDPFYKKIKEDLEYKRTVLQQRQEEFVQAFNGISYRNSHGDYQGCQVIWSNEEVKAVIDFAEARRLPVVWELMRSFIQTSQASRNKCELDVDMFAQYVKEYCKLGTLNENDIRSMPYVYVYQLLRSTYGYKDYLLTESEDREGLIAFAFWRTKMCRVVLEHADEITGKVKDVTHAPSLGEIKDVTHTPSLGDIKIQITKWSDEYAEDFKKLSLEWLEKYVKVELRDIETIEHPHEVILDKGGMTWFALADNKAVGTISILQEESGEWELAKMAVTEEYKGYGISNLLINEALAYSRRKGIEKLVLYTNSVLVPAVHQYHKYGFVDVPITEETYDTADLKMELKL